MKILIAEDNAVSREFLLNILSKYGVCDMVVNGIEAVEAFKMALDEERPYELLLLDIMMPIFDGTKVLKTIRKIEKDMKVDKANRAKVVIVSALYDKELVDELSEFGFDEYLRKPLDAVNLVNVVDRLLLNHS